MTKKINTYNDLLEEQARLKALFKVQKLVVKEDIKLIKEEFAPIRKAVGYIGKFTKRDSSNPLLNIASGRAIDLVLRRFVFPKAGLLTRIALPFLTKNLTSHLVADNKPQILGKLAGWFNKLRGHDAQDPENRKERKKDKRKRREERERQEKRGQEGLQTDPELQERMAD